VQAFHVVVDPLRGLVELDRHLGARPGLGEPPQHFDPLRLEQGLSLLDLLEVDDVSHDKFSLYVKESLVNGLLARPGVPPGLRREQGGPGTVTVPRQAADRAAVGPAYAGSGLVFTHPDGSPIHPQRFSDWFRQRVRAAGLPAIRLHDLRHSYATAALAAGIPAKVVSERRGHATIAITMDTYSHVLPGLDERAAATVARLILEGHESEPSGSIAKPLTTGRVVPSALDPGKEVKRGTPGQTVSGGGPISIRTTARRGRAYG
jgi:hypothetical protein